MKAYLNREALRFEEYLPAYKTLPDTIECDVEIEQSAIHLRIPLKKQEGNRRAPFEKALAYLENPNSESTIDMMASALEVDVD